MSAIRAYVLQCDEPDCGMTYSGLQIHRSKLDAQIEAREHGWYTSKRRDLCREHVPGCPDRCDFTRGGARCERPADHKEMHLLRMVEDDD